MNIYGLHGEEDNNGIKLDDVTITGNICGEYAEFTIKQSYINNSDENINGFYSFPIPEASALSGIEIELGGRHILGKVEDKEEALKLCEYSEQNEAEVFILEDIQDKGYRIGLGDILPGENLSISISYIEELEYNKNNLKLIIPALTKRSGVELCSASMNILIEPLSYAEFNSPSHSIIIEREDDLAKISLETEEMDIHKDFILNIIEDNPLEVSGVIYENTREDSALLYLRLIPETEDDDIITNMQIDWDTMHLEKTYPRTIDYMYGNKPFTVFAKIKGEVQSLLRVTGLIGDKRFQRNIILNNFSLVENESLLQKVWYKKRIDSLESRFMKEEEYVRESMKSKIAHISKKSDILSGETSLILYEEFEEPVLGGVIKRILPIKYINKH
ncbi:MAG: VIT domain-containing protein [Clostridium sp.]